MAGETVETNEVPEDSTEFEDEFDRLADEKTGGDPEPEEDPEDPKDPALAASEEEDPEPKPDAEPEEDPYEGMSDAVKARFQELEQTNDQLNHRLKSDAGRVSAFQRQVNDLRQENDTLRRAPPSAERPSQKQIADAMSGTDEGWKQFAEDFPDVAAAIDKRMQRAGEATQASVEKTLNDTLAPVVTRHNQQVASDVESARKEKVEAVAQDFPDWGAKVQTPEFQSWLSDQPPGVYALSQSEDTRDAASLLGMYDDHLVASGQPSIRSTPEPASDQEKDDPAPANGVAAKRAQQLEDGAAVESAPAKISASDQPADEFEAAFDAFAKRKEQQRASA